jgi:hypothetical protein
MFLKEYNHIHSYVLLSELFKVVGSYKISHLKLLRLWLQILDTKNADLTLKIDWFP